MLNDILYFYVLFGYLLYVINIFDIEKLLNDVLVEKVWKVVMIGVLDGMIFY